LIEFGPWLNVQFLKSYTREYIHEYKKPYTINTTWGCRSFSRAFLTGRSSFVSKLLPGEVGTGYFGLDKIWTKNLSKPSLKLEGFGMAYCLVILLMEEILHHQGCIKPCK